MTYVIILATLSLALVAATWLIRKRVRRQMAVLPEKIRLVKGLLSDISAACIRITPSIKLKEKSILTMSLKEVGSCIDEDPELSNEKYDDCKVLLDDPFDKVLDINKYAGNQLLPREIVAELRHFQNSRYKKVSLPGEYVYFAVSTGAGNRQLSMKDAGSLLEGNAEAFGSWLEFKEHAHSLHYVIIQWLAEHKAAAGKHDTQRRETASA